MDCNRRINLKEVSNIKLDLGCGSKPREGFVGLDYGDFGQDISWDANQGIPLPDNSVKHLYSHHALEHFDDILFIMNEIWRIVKPGGVAEIIVPWREHPNAWRHPGHIHNNCFDGSYWQWFSKNNKSPDVKAYGAKLWDIKRNEIIDECHSLFQGEPYGKA